MPEDKNPQNPEIKEQETAQNELNEFRVNVIQRRNNRQMVAPAPAGLNGQVLTPEQIQEDEEYIQNREQDLQNQAKGQRLNISLDDKKVIVEEFETVAATPDPIIEEDPNPEIEKQQLQQDYFNPDDFDYSSSVNTEDKSLTDEFNDIPHEPPTPEQGIEP